MKKTFGDIIILHICTKNYDQMMYGSSDLVCDGIHERMEGRADGQTDRQTDRQKK